MTNLDLSSVLGLDQLEQQQEQARANEEKAREVELKEFLARELPEDLLDEFSETSSEASEAVVPSPREHGVTHSLKVEGMCRTAPSRQQPDSHPCLSDEQFFHSSQMVVASTPSVPKEGWTIEPLSPLTASMEASPIQSQLSVLPPQEEEELLRLKILNEARCNEIRSLQDEMQQMDAGYHQQVSQLSEQLTREREMLSLATSNLEKVQGNSHQSHSRLSHLEQKLVETESERDVIRGENMKMSDELHSALRHLDNCKTQLENLCRSDVIDRLREQHINLIQQSDSDHIEELLRVREEMEYLASSYQDTIRRMDEEFDQQNGTYLSEIGHLGQELEKSEGLVDRLREKVNENELVIRVDELERQLSVSKSQEGDRLDENKQLELMLEASRSRSSESEIQRERVVRAKDTVIQEMSHKLSQAEVERKEALEQCRAACLELHEDSCNRLREKAIQEAFLKRETHERVVKELTGEITQLRQEVSNKEGSASIQEQLALKEMHEREVNRLSLEITQLRQEVSNKEGSASIQEQLALKQMHEREVNRLSLEITQLRQEVSNKEGSVSIQEQLALKEMHEREVNRLSQEITQLREEVNRLQGRFCIYPRTTSFERNA